MAIIKYFDVYVNGKLHKSHKQSKTNTAKKLLKKYSEEGTVVVKPRTEKIIETVEESCEGGKCPVKVTY